MLGNRSFMTIYLQVTLKKSDMKRILKAWNVACQWWAKVMNVQKDGVGKKDGRPMGPKESRSGGEQRKGEGGRKSARLVRELEEYLVAHYEFRYNVLTEMTEFRPWENGERRFRPATRRELNGICMDMRAAGIDCWDKDLLRYVESTRVENYHPFTLYLDELPVWDGCDRLDGLARRVSSEALWVKCFHRWMLALTAQWSGRTGAHANSVAPLLISREQGMLKSTFCKALMPKVLSDYYMDSFELTSQGQMEQKMAEMGLISLDEFDRFPASKMPVLKNVMQMATLNLRKAHQKNYRVLPRLASFIGTSNRKDLMTDPTGSRRFVCVEVEKKIDCEGIEHSQIFAQLKSELAAGAPYWFSEKEEHEIQEHNSAYYRRSAAEEVFYSVFRGAKKGEECCQLSLAEIFKRLKKQNPAAMRDANMVQLGQALTAAGVERKHTKYGNRYSIVMLGSVNGGEY